MTTWATLAVTLCGVAVLACTCGVRAEHKGPMQGPYNRVNVLIDVCGSLPKQHVWDFTSPAQVKDMLQARAELPDVCDNYEAGLDAINELLNDELLSDVCSPQAYGALRDFHRRFISPYVPEATRDELLVTDRLVGYGLEPLPESLKRFFIILTLQINAQCKRALVARIEFDELINKAISEVDFDDMRHLHSEGARLLADAKTRDGAKVAALDAIVVLPENVDALIPERSLQVRAHSMQKQLARLQQKQQDATQQSESGQDRAFIPHSINLEEINVKIKNIGKNHHHHQKSDKAKSAQNSGRDEEQSNEDEDVSRPQVHKDDDDDDEDEKAFEQDDPNKLYVQVKFGDELKRMKDLCRAKFMPVYYELFVPVIWLNNLGYTEEYHTKHENDKLDWDARFTRWYRVIEICEVLKNIVMIEDASSYSALATLINVRNEPAAPDAPVAPSVVVLSFEEAKKARDRIKNNMRDNKSMHLAQIKSLRGRIKHVPQVFSKRLWLADDPQRMEKFCVDFVKRTRKLIDGKVNWARMWRNDMLKTVSKQLGFSGGLDFVSRGFDRTEALERIESFFMRHATTIRAIALVFTFITIAMHFG